MKKLGSDILKQYASGISRSDFSKEERRQASDRRLALRSAIRVGNLWRGLDGVWRDQHDRVINITQKTHSGKFFNLLEPNPNHFSDGDLALGLSREHRWNGQTSGRYGYSVAQHSIAMVEYMKLTDGAISKEALLFALLHDAEEGLGVKDTVTGFKIVLGQTYIEIANAISEAIHIKYGLQYPPDSTIAKKIKEADAVLGMTEAKRLMGFSTTDYRKRVQNKDLRPMKHKKFIEDFIDPWEPSEACARYLSLLGELAQ